MDSPIAQVEFTLATDREFFLDWVVSHSRRDVFPPFRRSVDGFALAGWVVSDVWEGASVRVLGLGAVDRISGEPISEAIRLDVLPSTRGAQVDASCSHAAFLPYFHDLLGDVEQEWPESRDAIAACLGHTSARVGTPSTSEDVPPGRHHPTWVHVNSIVDGFIEKGQKPSVTAVARTAHFTIRRICQLRQGAGYGSWHEYLSTKSLPNSS